MAPVVLGTVAALVVAALVLVVAGAVGGRTGGLRQFVTDLDAGLRDLLVRDGSRAERRAERRAEEDDAEDAGSVGDLFAVGSPDDRDYLTAEELRGTFARVARRR